MAPVHGCPHQHAGRHRRGTARGAPGRPRHPGRGVGGLQAGLGRPRVRSRLLPLRGARPRTPSSASTSGPATPTTRSTRSPSRPEPAQARDPHAWPYTTPAPQSGCFRHLAPSCPRCPTLDLAHPLTTCPSVRNTGCLHAPAAAVIPWKNARRRSVARNKQQMDRWRKHAVTQTQSSGKSVQRLDRVVIRFAGDSGDGMQLTGDRFTSETAALGNDLSTLPNFPAEIRAPQGTLPGVSGFQLHFADHDVLTPGDAPDVLVAMNPAALKANLRDLPARRDDHRQHRRVLEAQPRQGRLRRQPARGRQPRVLARPPGRPDLDHGRGARGVRPLSRKDKERAKNMFALGLLSWMYRRPTTGTERFLEKKFGSKPDILAANLAALKAGLNYGETTEDFAVSYEIAPAKMAPGTYRNITGNAALALGLVAASHRAGIPLVLGSYPITPASTSCTPCAGLKRFGVTTLQAEDEIAGIGAALGASFGGAIGVTTTSGPGVALKSETIGLGVSLELPARHRRRAARRPLDGPADQDRAVRPAAGDVRPQRRVAGADHRAPVARPTASTPRSRRSGSRPPTARRCSCSPTATSPTAPSRGRSRPWRSCPTSRSTFATEPNDTDDKGEPVFHPFLRDETTLARPWAIPGTPGLEHRIGGIEKANVTGNISYDPDNHDLMTRLRAAKVERIADTIGDLEVDDPSGEATVLVLGWGSTYGPIAAAARSVRNTGAKVARAHLRHLNPFPANTGEVLRRYDRVLVPEMNMGQLAMLLRAKFLVDVHSFTQVRGLPFTTVELADAIVSLASGDDDDADPGLTRGRQGRTRMSTELGMPSIGVRCGTAGVPHLGDDAPKQTKKEFTSDQEVRWCPGLRRLRDPRRRAGLPARARTQAREHRVRLRHRLLVAVPLLPRHLRHALDPRARPGDRDRPGDQPRRPVGLGRHRRRRRPLDRRQPPHPRAAPQRQPHDPVVQQPDLRPDQGPVLAHLRGRQGHQVDADGLGRPPLQPGVAGARGRGDLRGADHRHRPQAPHRRSCAPPPSTGARRWSRSTRTARSSTTARST